MNFTRIRFARWLLALLLLVSVIHSGSAVMAAQKAKATHDDQAVKMPEHLGAENVDHLVAGLSDEQVRRLLIDELKAQALLEAQQKTAQSKPVGIAGFIHKTRNLMTTLQTRIEFLRSGGTETPQKVAGIFVFLGTGENQGRSPASVILTVAAVLAGGLLVQWLFVLYTRGVRRRISEAIPSGWGSKIGTLGTRALLDLAGILVFVMAALAFFYVFLDRSAGQRVLLAAYLAGFAIVQAAWLVSRMFLAPHLPRSRFLPFSDQTSRYLHRWFLALTAVTTFGLLTNGVVRLAGASELTYFKLSVVVGLLVLGMIVWMIVQKRKSVAAALSQGLPETSLRHRLAQKWHHFAIFGVLVLFALSVGARILGTAAGQSTLTLLMVPLYFLLDWVLRLILKAAFDIVETPQEGQVVAAAAQALPEGDDQVAMTVEQTSTDEGKPPAAVVAAQAAPEGDDRVETTAEETPAAGPKPQAPEVPMELGRLKHALQAGLRIALAALLVFWIFKIWGVEFQIGEKVAKTALNILIVVLVCYVAYSLANAAILRRLRAEMPAEESEEMEEGGSGGSRIGTLLMLLRKFMLVVIIIMAVLIILSSLGVNIGPLIAGAGVFGLAIGFGAQTLVKDIISGMFFLIDDAIRVGDYVECGGAKGMVEKISLRSLRLRHPRGQVFILPFGDIKNVTNLSRDYVIMKLDFRVRYDADVEKIRKIIKKKVYQPIMEDPELGPMLLDPIKSQGVREMDDSAMIMRVKYKTKPGDQFMIRKEVYRLMQEAFKEEGIEFAHRNVTVYVPPETRQAVSAAPDGSRDKFLAGAAAAVVAAEEEKRLEQEKTP